MTAGGNFSRCPESAFPSTTADGPPRPELPDPRPRLAGGLPPGSQLGGRPFLAAAQAGLFGSALCAVTIAVRGRKTVLRTPAMTTAADSRILPFDLVEECMGKRIWILLRGHQEFTGTLAGFDDYVNLVLEDVTEYGQNEHGMMAAISRSEQMLLNGSHIAVMIPGGAGPS